MVEYITKFMEGEMSEALKKSRKIDALLAEYGQSHQNPFNKKIHWIAVPVIFWTVLALLWSIPTPALFDNEPMLNWGTLLLLVTLVYYFIQAPVLAIGMANFSILCVILVRAYEKTISFPLWQGALVIFIIAWGFQFWGHKVEGKKPSFFKDVQFLLIGPAWLMSFIYQRLGIKY